MTKTQYYVAASIDGYIADADGGLGWLLQFNGVEGVDAHYKAFLGGVGALAMGAATYEFLLAESREAWPYADLPTWVFTHRDLPAIAGGDIRFTTEDVGLVHEQMVRAAGGKHIWLIGGGNLVAQFAKRGLLNEILLGIAPVVLGSGAPLLPASIPGPLELSGITRFGRGFVELRYEIPAGLDRPHAARAAET
ncbi:dihydrofolate reductase family protein [Polyangium sorediatum]|uniref:Dihydrofolate reductase family protein n=1 Tax=Polyangium sorediatum TaxID=889274 RepID=A0ABT6PAC9_9BACT|nr:dihydrofolate reductase family protein [Polyangium sorediatum]MDI1437493.1 dihydrofolate reductase family protein [Polyangium sorediatum]